jgi:hypothetical protein
VSLAWRRDYAKVMLADLWTAKQLYLQSNGKPEFLMLSLYHAQQVAEKALKLFSVLTGLCEDLNELRKRLGHTPLIGAFMGYVNEVRESLRSFRRSLGERGLHTSFINSYEMLLSRIHDSLKEYRKLLKDCSSALHSAFELEPLIYGDLKREASNV